jgi:hypothetical protein
MATPYLKSLVQVNAFGNTVGVEGPLVKAETAVSVSAAGTAGTFGVLSSAQEILPSNLVTVTAGAGAGAYTSIVVLSAANHLAGDKADVVINLPASANPTVTVRNATAAGTVLLTVANAGGTARVVTGEFVFNGTAWVLLRAAVASASIA